MAMPLSPSTTPAPPSSIDPISVTARSTTAEGSGSQASPATTMLSSDLSPAAQRFTFRPLRRSSSRIQRWVQDQQKRHSTGEPAEGALDAIAAAEPASDGRARQATPQVTVQRPSLDGEDVVMLDDSFVLVEEGGERRTQNAQRGQPTVVDLSSSPPAPRKNRQGAISFSTPHPLRTFARNLTQNRRLSTSTTTTVREASPARASIFPRPAHTRTASFTNTLFSQRSRGDTTSEASELSSSPSASTWRFRPAGIMSHFHSASDGMVDELPRPRPSTSSSISRSSETAQTRTSFESVGTSQYRPSKRAHTPSMIFNPTPSLWSLPTDASHMDDPPESTKTIAREREKSGSVRIPLPLRNSPGSAPAILPSQKRKRKRKLVISGIPPGDQRRYEHVRMWCESFGELSQMTRLPNGDLHVDFRRSEVADTVCRLHARVHINGVGSVGLSWYTGKRP
ncbi:hypothetical protein PsYK624_019550 [Phanerochaete sordida]|uniref:RRM domain-containing protein n=1 Tax=Phanerochaete sordida TaxID=48140 RepID=A0A9P3G0C1_9APHY|nr:hypothetical protein PsYK624_019550 [Phanerochaete sordida]